MAASLRAHINTQNMDHWTPMMMVLSGLNSKVNSQLKRIESQDAQLKSQGAQLNRIENKLDKLISVSSVGESRADSRGEDVQAASSGKSTVGGEGGSERETDDEEEGLQPPPAKKSKLCPPPGPSEQQPHMPQLMRRFASKLDRMESMTKSSGTDATSQAENSTKEFQSTVDSQPGPSEQMPRLMKRVASKLDRMESMLGNSGAGTASQAENSTEEFKFNGTNLLRLQADDPCKYALAAIDVLFTKEELSSSLLYSSKKSKKTALDQEKVELLLRAMERKFGKESDKWNLTTLKKKINQKCRDTKL